MICQRIGEIILGRRPIERRRRSYFPKPPTEDPEVSTNEDSGILGSIRLYKRAARMSRENALLLPTEEGRRRGLSAIEEVTTSLKARFTPDFNPTDFDTADFDPSAFNTADFNTADFNTADFNTADFNTADFNTAELVSSKEIVEELRYQDSSKACGIDGIHIRLIKTLAETSFIDVLAALFNSCIRLGRTPRV
jgi:hypothetical protein